MEFHRLLAIEIYLLGFSYIGVVYSNGPDNSPNREYWPTRSELVMPGGHKGAAVPVDPVNERLEPDRFQHSGSSAGRRGKAVVISVRPDNAQGPQQDRTITEEDWRMRVRNREIRKFDIQRRIMDELRLSSRPNISGIESLNPRQIESLENQMNRRESSRKHHLHQTGRSSQHQRDPEQWDPELEDRPESDRTDSDYNSKRFLALPAVCPRSTADWFTGGGFQFRLYFLVDPPFQSRDRKTRVTSAILRLYRKSFNIQENPDRESIEEDNNVADDNVNYDDDDDNDGDGAYRRERSKRGQMSRNNQQRIPKQRGERKRKILSDRNKRTLDRRSRGTGRLTLTVYQYMQPLRRNAPDEQKKKIKSVILKYPYLEGEGPVGSDWVRINIKAAVREWYKDPEVNHGLELVVTNANQQIDPTLVFYGFNCSDSASTADAAALMSLSMQDENDEDRAMTSDRPGPSQGMTPSQQRTVKVPHLSISTVDSPRRVHKSRLRRHRGRYQ